MARSQLILTALALIVGASAGAATLTTGDSFNARKMRGAFLERGVGGKAVAMGEAFVAVADDPSAVSWNPGGLGLSTGPTFLVMYDVVGQGLGSTYIAGSMPYGYGFAGLSVTFLRYGAMDVRDISGAKTGTYNPTDLGIAGSFAFANPGWVGGKGWSGFSVEFIKDTVGAAMFGGSLGTVVPISPRLTLGAVAKHIGPAKDSFSLPASVHAGASLAATKALLVATDIGYGLIDKLIVIALGAEFKIGKPFALRMGYKWNRDQGFGGITGITGGIGVKISTLGFDYAYQPFGELAQSHRFALTFALKSASDRPVRKADVTEDYALALEFYRQGSYATALEETRSILAADPAHSQTWQLAGNCRYATGDRAGALAAYRRALALNPRNDALRAWIATVTAQEDSRPGRSQSRIAEEFRAAAALYAGSDYSGALVRARNILAVDPGHAEAWQLVGNCQYALRNRDDAIAAYRRSLVINPDNPSLRAWLRKLIVK